MPVKIFNTDVIVVHLCYPNGTSSHLEPRKARLTTLQPAAVTIRIGNGKLTIGEALHQTIKAILAEKRPMVMDMLRETKLGAASIVTMLTPGLEQYLQVSLIFPNYLVLGQVFNLLRDQQGSYAVVIRGQSLIYSQNFHMGSSLERNPEQGDTVPVKKEEKSFIQRMLGL